MTETLVDMLQRGESSARGYNDYNRFGPPAGDPRPARGADRAIDFSQMTLADIQADQRLPWNHADKLNAVGRYQMVRPTLHAAMQELNLDPSEKFTPQLQDRILVDYLLKEKQPAIHAYITGEAGSSLRAAQSAMAGEWASVGDPVTGRSRYANNHAAITPSQSAAALQNAHDQYAAAIAAGKSPDEAWRAAAGLGAQQTQTQGQAQSQGQGTTPSHPELQHTGVLKQGAHGAEVETLQRSLAALGYTGKDGKPLAADKDFGANTDHALRDFQQAHGIKVDGKAGPETQRALAQAEQDPLVSEATHPAHGLYAAIRAKLPPGTSPQVAANVTMSAVENGITSADKLKSVDLSADRNMVFLRGTNEANRTHVDLQAPGPSLQQSSDYLQAHANQPQITAPQPIQAQTLTA